MRYPYTIRQDGTYFVVTFPDFPEALTQGATEEEARAVAGDALETALDFYFEDGRPVPLPSACAGGSGGYVDLPLSLAAKVLLLNEMLAQRIRPAELARRLATTPQEVNRLVDLHHTSKIDRVASAMRAIGKRLTVTAE